MSKTDVVLLAVAEICVTHPTLAASVFDVAILAWIKDQKAFGLPGYERMHPDSKKVSVALQHLLGRTISSQGGYERKSDKLLERIGPNRVRPTEAGWRRAVEKLGANKPTYWPCDAGFVG